MPKLKMIQNMKGYKTSKDYKKLKKLIDEGLRIICLVPYDETSEEATCVCTASLYQGWYHISSLGVEYGTYWPEMHRYKSFEDMCENIRVEFIEPNEENHE